MVKALTDATFQLATAYTLVAIAVALFDFVYNIQTILKTRHNSEAYSMVDYTNLNWCGEPVSINCKTCKWFSVWRSLCYNTQSTDYQRKPACQSGCRYFEQGLFL